MDPSQLNKREAALSIVKEAPLASHDATAPSHLPKWLIDHASRPETCHNCHVDVTQRYLPCTIESFHEPPFGGRCRRHVWGDES